MVLGAAEALHAFAVSAAGGVDVFRDRRGADEADRAHARIREQRVDRLLVAIDDIEDARRQPGFDEEFGKPHRHRWIALRRLEDEGVAAGERGRELPHRNHGREVERRDARNDPERLAQRVEIDAGSGALAEFAFEQVRDAAGEFDHFQSALDVALGVGDGLAVLRGEQLGEAVEFPLRQLEELEQHPRAALRIGGGPRGLRRLGVGDRRFHFRLVGGADLRLNLAGIGVEQVAAAAGCAPHWFTTDEMTDFVHQGLLRCLARIAEPLSPAWDSAAGAAREAANLTTNGAATRGGERPCWPVLLIGRFAGRA